MMIHDLAAYYDIAVLEFHLTGADALRVAAQPIQQTQAEMMGVVRKIFGAGQCLPGFVPKCLN